MKINDLKIKPIQGAGCLIIASSTSRIFLLQRSQNETFPLTWAFPGGSVDPAESPYKAAKREMLEETGIDLSTINLKLAHRTKITNPYFEYYTYFGIVQDEFTPVLNYESESYGWFDLDELPTPLHPGVQTTFSYLKSSKEFNKIVRRTTKIIDNF